MDGPSTAMVEPSSNQGQGADVFYLGPSRIANISVYINRSIFQLRESSLQVTKTTYGGLKEHRIIVYTATGQKVKLKVHLSTETTLNSLFYDG
jgi:hypothetical protein